MSKQELPLRIGLYGISAETISEGDQGYCWFPVGKFDLKTGGREWVRVEVTAMETVRANRDVVVANEQGDVKEATPVELSFEREEGGYERVTEEYESALPIRNFGSGDHKKWGFKEYTAAATRNDIADGLTAPHDLTPDSGKTLVVQNILIFASADSTVTIQGGDGTTYYTIYKAYLAANGGSNAFNLGIPLKQADDKLYITVTAGNVSVTIVCDQK